MDNIVRALRTFLRLALPYFRSEERWTARLLLVGVIGILAIQLQLIAGGPTLTQIDVIALALGCLMGALGGLLSRFPPQRQARRW